MSTTKELRIRASSRMPNLYEAFFVGGGELPVSLQGCLFTDKTIAQRAIDTHLAGKKTNGKARTSHRTD